MLNPAFLHESTKERNREKIRGKAVVGSALLLPSIILGYAVKAAEREDKERGA